MTWTCRALTADEASTWRQLRLEALKICPDAFLTTYDEALATPLKLISERLSLGNTFGAFEDTVLFGIASLIPMTHRVQMRHRAEIGAVFLRPAAQGTGASDMLVAAIVDRARALGVTQLELHAAADNPRAIGFYHRNGFREMGRVPNATIRDGKVTDDVFMVRMHT